MDTINKSAIQTRNKHILFFYFFKVPLKNLDFIVS